MTTEDKRLGSSVSTPCVEGKGWANHHGYCQVKRNGKIWPEHRLAYHDAFGPIPKGMFVLHRCDNRLCVNVDHLFLGTKKENTRDAILKKRVPHLLSHKDGGTCKVGESHASAKLSDDDTRWIRKLVRSGALLREAGAMFGVHLTHAWRVSRWDRYD